MTTMTTPLSHDEAYRAGVEVGQGTRGGPTGPLNTPSTRDAFESGVAVGSNGKGSQESGSNS
jgi:hypothetical protein